MASDPELLVVRRFDELHTRALLYKQDQLSELEEQLKELNEKYTKQGDIDNGTFRGDMDKRRKLDEELFETLLAFGAVTQLVGWNKTLRPDLLTKVQVNCSPRITPCVRSRSLQKEYQKPSRIGSRTTAAGMRTTISVKALVCMRAVIPASMNYLGE